MSVEIKRIFCPVDLRSEDADSLFLPLALARDFRANITFCCCLPKHAIRDAHSDYRKIERLISKAGIHLTPPAALPECSILIIKTDNIARKIVCRAAQNKSDLIVMHTNSHPFIKSHPLGSVAEAVSRAAPCPVLVLPPEKHQTGKNSRGFNFRRILAAYDFSDDAEIALQNASALSKKYHAELHLLHVLDDPSDDINGYAENRYHQTVKRLQTAASAGQITAVRWGKTYREILRYAEENEIDLIAMGAHGADFGMQTLFGSNVDRVLRQASRVVLVAYPLKPACVGRAREISRQYA